MNPFLIQSFLRQTAVLRAPRRALSTFGSTSIEYHLISPVEDLKDRTRLRQGRVLSQKPQILTPESFAERFEGFGAKSSEFAQWIQSSYRDLLRAIEYNFKNTDFAAQVISEKPQEVTERINADLDSREIFDRAIIHCPDGAWSLALMKFTLDEVARSFPIHVRDLERRGLFDPAGKLAKQRRLEIERLFSHAASDRMALADLGRKLREYGLFEEYEDRYLSFF